MFRITDLRTGEVVIEGSTKECADYLDIKLSSFYTNCYYGGVYRKHFLIEEVSVADLDQEAIRKWNAFTEPLRKKFGIPVYRG